MVSSLSPSRPGYNPVVAAAAGCSQWQVAMQLFSEMPEASPGLWSLNDA